MIFRLLILCAMLLMPVAVQADTRVIGPGHEAFVEVLISGDGANMAKSGVRVLGIQIEKDHLVVTLEGIGTSRLSLHPRGQLSAPYAQTASFDVSWSGVAPDPRVDAFVRGLTQRDRGVFWDRVQIEAKDGVSSAPGNAICRRASPGNPRCCSSIGLCPDEWIGLGFSPGLRKLLLLLGALAWMLLIGLCVFAIAKVGGKTARTNDGPPGFLRLCAWVSLLSLTFLALRWGLLGNLIPADQRLLLWDEMQHVFTDNQLGWSAHGAVWLFGVLQYFTGQSMAVLVPLISMVLGLLTLWLMAHGISRALGEKRIALAFLGLAIFFPPLAVQGAMVSFGHVTSFLLALAIWSAWVGIEQREWRPVARISTLLLGFCGPLSGLMMIPPMMIIRSYGSGSTRWARPLWVICCAFVIVQNVALTLSGGVALQGLPASGSAVQLVLLSIFGAFVLLGMLRSYGSEHAWRRWLVYIELLLILGSFLVPGPHGWQAQETFFTLALWWGCPLALYGTDEILGRLQGKTGWTFARGRPAGVVVLLILLSLCWQSGVQRVDGVERLRGLWMHKVNTSVWPVLSDLEGSTDLILEVPDNFAVLPAEWSELLSFEVASRSLFPRGSVAGGAGRSQPCLIWQIYQGDTKVADALLGECSRGAQSPDPLFRWEANGAISRLVSCQPSRCSALSDDASFSRINTLSGGDIRGQISLWLQREKKP